jgi:hypothetical protein
MRHHKPPRRASPDSHAAGRSVTGPSSARRRPCSQPLATAIALRIPNRPTAHALFCQPWLLQRRTCRTRRPGRDRAKTEAMLSSLRVLLGSATLLGRLHNVNLRGGEGEQRVHARGGNTESQKYRITGWDSALQSREITSFEDVTELCVSVCARVCGGVLNSLLMYFILRTHRTSKRAAYSAVYSLVL